MRRFEPDHPDKVLSGRRGVWFISPALDAGVYAGSNPVAQTKIIQKQLTFTLNCCKFIYRCETIRCSLTYFLWHHRLMV